MIPNCEGCKYEYEEGIKYIKKDYGVCWRGLGKKRHLFIAVFDKKGKMILG